MTPLAILPALLLSCGQPDPVAPSLQPWPREPAALRLACQEQAFRELATTCWVQLAATLAQAGDEQAAAQACAEIEGGVWREECHFRLGEELAVAGKAVPAAAWCAQAGWFARRCLTHAAWRLRRDPGPMPTLSDGEELLSAVEASLAAHPDPGVAGEGRDAFRAAWGRAAFRGRGRADPLMAREPGELGAALRTGWALEALRLLVAAQGGLPADAGDRLRRAWERREALVGEALDEPPPERSPPLRSAEEDAGLPHLPLYGGGLRLVGETIDEDAEIAILYALYGHVDCGPEPFRAALADPRPRVRWSAASILALLVPAEERHALAQEADDPRVARRLRAGGPPPRPAGAP